MGSRPQCERLVGSLTDETSYGTATVDGSLTEMFSLVDPVFADHSQDIQDDRDLLKGHEWLEDVNAYEVIFDNRSIPLTNIPASAEFMAYVIASALGDVASAAQDTEYQHTILPMDICADGAQLPSRTFGILFSGTSALNTKYKGCCVDSVTIRGSDRGRITMDVTWVTDGSESDGSSISVPASFHTSSFYFGKDVEIKEDTYAVGSLSSFKTILRSFELTINNNLLVDEAKATNWATAAVLPKLEYGVREITMSLSLLGDETTAQYVHAADQDMMVSELTLGGPTLTTNDADTIITFPKHLWEIGPKSYDGTERIFQLDYALFYDSTETAPIKFEITTADAAVI